jgi:hypothetical protein
MTTDNSSGTDQATNAGTGYSETYVKQLREEAASWRTKFRELQSQFQSKEIETGLAQRGIKAKASWVEVKEGQSLSEALDAFAEEFPHLVSTKEEEEEKTTVQPDDKITKTMSNRPKPLAPPPTNIVTGEVKDLSKHLADRSLNQLKDDPKSRKLVQEFYVNALAQRH